MYNSQKDFHKKLLGQVGEKQVVKYLKKNKFKILEKNYTCPVGEIDILAKDGDYLCFLEVKTRVNENYGTPSMAVTPDKQRHIALAATSYLKRKSLLDAYCRFDVAEVLFEDNDNFAINYIEDAFRI